MQPQEQGSPGAWVFVLREILELAELNVAVLEEVSQVALKLVPKWAPEKPVAVNPAASLTDPTPVL